MSFIIKNQEITLAVSIVPVNESGVSIFATDFRRKYFFEKGIENDELNERINEINAVRLPIKKVLKALACTAPNKSTIGLNDDGGMKLELEFKIIVNEITQKSERLKVYFNMTECTTIQEVSENFTNGLVSSVIETISPTKINLPEPSFKIDPNLYEAFGNDLSRMMGATTERDLSQVVVERKVSESNLLGRKRNNKKAVAGRPVLKPTAVERKKFEYKESDSQELTDDIPSEPIEQFPKPVIEKKRKKPNLKF